MKVSSLVLALAVLLTTQLHAQVCDSDTPPNGLQATYSPGVGALLEWNAVPGSVGVQLQVASPSGTVFSRRIMAFELDQFLIPDSRLSPGVYLWRLQAACNTLPPYGITPVSASGSFTAGGFGLCPDSVSDIDGNRYPVVLIGGQCWMAENLKVEHYRNGDAIPTGLDDSAWEASLSGAYTLYENLLANKDLYGLLYNWFAVTDSRGLCPTGWSVPSDGEFTEMMTVLDPLTCGDCTGTAHSNTAGGALKSTGVLSSGTGLWASPNAGATNSSGFSALPGGFRLPDGDFNFQGEYGYWWTDEESIPERAWIRLLSYNTSNTDRFSNPKQFGLSVRCLKD